MWPRATTEVGPRSIWMKGFICRNTHGRTHAHAHTYTRFYIENKCRQTEELSRPRHKEKHWDTTATRDDLNFHMDRSFILKRNKRQICHPTEHCVCSLNVRVKILPYFEEDRALISQLALLHPSSFATWLGQSNRLNKHCMFTQQQVKRLSITSLCLRLCSSLFPRFQLLYSSSPSGGKGHDSMVEIFRVA